MKLIGQLDKHYYDEQGNVSLVFSFTGDQRRLAKNCIVACETLKNAGKTALSVKVEEQKKKRSLSANAYAWTLIRKLSETTGINEIDVYRTFIQDCGIYRQWEIDNASAETIIKAWSMLGLGWIAEKVDEGETGYTIVRAFYGSSSYNTKQMAAFIENIVNECKLYGIETKTPREIEEMVSRWKGEIKTD